MRRWLVGVGVGLALVLAVLVVALRNVGHWIESHRDWIGARVSDAIGRPVSFGEVGASLFPTLAVRVADVRVGDDPAWSKEPFLTARGVDVKVAVLPALLGRVVVRRVVLDGPVVTVIRGARGRNVDSLVGLAGGGGASPGGAERAAGRATDTTAAASESVAVPLAIGAGSVRDGRLRLVDRRAKRERTVEVRDLDGTITGLAPDRAARIEVRAAMPGAERQNLRLAGTVGPLDAAALGRTGVAVELRGDGLDLARLREAVPEVDAAVPGPLGIDGPLDATVSVAGTAEAPTFDATIDATDARVTWAEWFDKTAGVALELTAAGRQVGAGAHLDHFALRLAELTATGHGDASPSRVAMHLDAEPAALRPLAALLPALAARRLGGRIGARVDVEGAVTEGRTPAVTGAIALRDVSVASDEPRFELAGLTQTIRLEGDAAVLPETTMRLNGAPVVAQGRIGRFGAPVLALSDLDVRIFGGRVRGGAQADRSGPGSPRLAAELRVEGVDVAEAAAMRAPGLARALAGRLSGEMRLGARGTGGEALRRSLAGDGRFAVTGGVLRGVNIVDRVLAGATQVPGLAGLVPPRLRAKYPAVFGGEDTRFDELSSVWRLAEEVVRLEHVAVAARDFTAEGHGTLALDGRLEATGELQLAQGLSDDVTRATKVAELLRNARRRVVVPFAVEGTWPRVRVTPDVRGLARAVQGGAIQQGLDRLLDGLLKR